MRIVYQLIRLFGISWPVLCGYGIVRDIINKPYPTDSGMFLVSMFFLLIHFGFFVYWITTYVRDYKEYKQNKKWAEESEEDGDY